MKRFKGVLYAATMLLALMFSCSSPTDTPTDFTVTITGAVLRQNAVALDSVVTVLDNPFRRDTVKSDGLLTISFTSAAKSAVTANLTFQRPRFYDTTIAVTYGPSAKSVALNIVKMRAVSSADDSVIVRVSKRPGVIVHLGTSVTDLSIRDAGGTDVATITFEVRDSSGVPVDAGNKALVGFRLVTKPDASTYLSVDSASTNSVGTVSVQLTAGTTAGIAQVMAVAAVKKSDIPLVYDTLRSPVVSIPIHGGAPDSAHFSIASEKYNVAGGVKYNIQTIISALVGDKFGNAVQPGTVVSFRSNGGVIQSYGTTTDDGAVAVILRTGEPVPAGGLVTVTAEIGGSGLSAIRKAKVAEKESDDATVVATATRKGIPKPLASYVAKSSLNSERSNASGTFKRTLQILFSGATQIHVVDTNFVVPVGSSKQVNFTVSDADGNPLSGGSTVNVSAAGQGAGDVELSGDIQKTIPDTKSPAYTSFRVFLLDKRTSGTDQTKPIDLRIEVASDNGNLTMPVAGRLLNAAGSDSGRIGSISLVNSNPDSITVNGAGISSTSIQFKVLDVFGKPAANIPLGFEFVKSVNGGEYLTPISAKTDVNGLASTTLVGGIRSGTVQVGARVKIDSVSITSPAKSVYIRTGFVSSIALVSSSSSHVSVQGSGGTESATLVFEARDTLGNAIDLANQTQIGFLLRGDTAGTKISPNPVTTDPATGRIVANFTSGTKSGIVQIYATARSGIVKSSPVSMTIYGGAPDSSHFSLVSEKYNLAGGVKFGLKTKITVLLGDTYGNPVQPGTGVYFSTTGGIIQSTGTTAEDGSVSVDLTTSDPVPPSGFAIVSARIGSGGKANASVLPRLLANFKRQKAGTQEADAALAAPMTYTKTIPVLFSGHTQIAVTDTNFLVPVGGTKQVNYRVSDPNGNPLSAGTSIKVTATGQAAGDVELSGDIDKTLLDTWDPAFTSFRVSVRDKRTTGTTQLAPVDLRIDVVSDNDNATATASGRLLSIQGSDSGKVGKIVLMNSDPDTVTVSGAGVATKALQFKVLDVFDKPAANVPISFTVTRSVNGGEYLTPQSANSDVNGLVTTTITSGIRSGLVQVMAQAQAGTQSITSAAKSVYIKTGAVTNIVLVSSSTTNVSVRGGGGAQSATLIFEARDTLGNAIDFANQTSISFLLRGDTAGSAIFPNPATTDPATGRVVASFTSGTKSGIVQIYATAKSGLVKSSAASMSVYGGAADSSHFSLTAAKYNIAGAVKYNLRTTITALLADKNGNPVQPGTPVSFSSTGGTIQSTASTNADGVASVDLISSEPVPSNGLVTVTAAIGSGSQAEAVRVLPNVLARFAKTRGNSTPGLDQAPNQYSKSLTILFSGHTQIAIADTNFIVSVGGTKQINYTVSDANGNPLSGGSTVKVSAAGQGAGDVELTGDIDRTIPDTRDAAFTTFRAFIRDKRTTGLDQLKPVDLRVDVSSDNDPKTASTSGRLLSLASVSDSGKVGKIVLMSSNPDTIAVTGGGGTNTVQIQFKVLDAFDNVAPNIPVSFDIIRSVGGGEYLLPVSATSDVNGLVNATLKSGIRSGLVQLVARVRRDSVSIVSPAKTVYISTGQIAQIAFISVSTSEVSVQGVGGSESSTIVFEGHDSLGNALDFTHQTPIKLIVRGDTTGTHINPNPAMTDPVTGRIVANFSPGVRAGVVQVYATALSGTVTSAPVPITIHGGFADQAHFTISKPPKNISSMDYTGLTFSVVVGDKWSNPVKPGTMVYFSASGGVITASGPPSPLGTDEFGIASAKWMNVNPFPTNGFLWVKARTIGENGQFVQDSVNVMYSGASLVTFSSSSVVNDSLKLLDGSFADINYIVADLLGHPLSTGNTVTVSVGGPAATDLDLTGITNFIVPETIDTVGGTHFTFRVGDKFVGTGKTNPFTIKVTVDGISGHMEKVIYGILYAPGDISVPPSARKPAQIGYLGSTASEIFVSGVGATENAMITYEVRDSLGVPISRAERTYATFSLQFFPNTFAGGGTAPTILPSADSTDDLGKLRVSILSGSAAGTVQVRASIQTPGGPIVSEPVKISVHAGFPDQKHFTIAPTQYNFPGLAKAYLPQTITVQVGDRYSNPVQQGTAVYFNTAHGIITTGMTTDQNGFISNTLYSANPMPLGADTLQFPDPSHHGEGFSRLYARTFGQAAAQIIDSVDILWTGPPVIVNTTPILSQSYTMPNGQTSGPYTFTVMDLLGHPMSPGTTISVTGDALVMSGDGVNITMPDVMDGGPGFTSFTVYAEDADATTTAAPPKKSQITLRVVHPIYGTYTRVLATGTVQ